MNLALFLFGYTSLFLSILGYGKIINKYVLNLKDQNVGMSGIIGIFSITLIIYFLNFFIKISLVVNSVIHLIGIMFFLYYFINNRKIIKTIEIYIPLFFLLVFILFLLSAKPHDDFEYYHFSYMNYLNNEIASLGIGNFNHGFRTHSSIFYFTSSFYLPLIEDKLLHSGSIFYIIFSNLILIKKIFSKNNSKNNFIKFLSLLAFAFINIIFYRMSEHGTDRSAQILITILIIEILEKINFKDNDNIGIYNIMILFSLIISLKAFYSVYLILVLPIIILQKNKLNFLKTNIFNRVFFISLTLIMFFYSVNLINTGCLIYPLNISCFDELSWSIPMLEVNQMRDWYELWAKAGANPNMRVQNPGDYINSFNWVNNWIDMYFFNKVLDFLIAVIFIFIVTFFIFLKKKKKKYSKKIKFITIYTFILLLLFEWFINHPSLRYGGFSLFALLIFIPGAIYLSKHEYNPNIFLKRKILFITFVIIIFAARNIDRINSEIKNYNYNFLSYPSYNINFKNYNINNIINELKKKCTENIKLCEKEIIKYKKFYDKSLYYRK